MSDNPYVNEHLTATQAGIPDPLVELDCWLSQLTDLLTSQLDTTVQAYDILALWAKLRRVRPELVRQLGGVENLAESEALVSELGKDLATHALMLPDAEAWLDEATALQSAYEDVALAEARNDLAERMLADLDDAQLVLYAARRLGVDDPELDSDLARCSEWMTEHIELFLAASVTVQAVGMTFRPNLADFDYGLAVTALKYIDVLRAAEAAETALRLTNVQPFNPQIVIDWVAKSQQQRNMAEMLRSAFVALIVDQLHKQMGRRPMAQAADETELMPMLWWEWSSPEDNHRARLVVPPRPLQDSLVTLQFLSGDRTAASELEGQRVTLHGTVTTIDSKGQATFYLTDFLQVNEPLVLRIGSQEAPWPLVTGSTLT